MYASVHANRRTMDYSALLRVSQTSSSGSSGSSSSSSFVPPPTLAEMRQVAELTSAELANDLSWLLTASPLAAELSGDDDDEEEQEQQGGAGVAAKWRRLVHAGLSPSAPVCSIHCSDPVLILRTLAHWCVPWRATPASFLRLLFVVPLGSNHPQRAVLDVSAPLRAALQDGAITDLCVRDAAERVVHARAAWHATMTTIARTDVFLQLSHDIDPIDVTRASSDSKYELFCPISRILRTAALHRLFAVLVVAADDARHAHGRLAQDSIDLLEYLLVQHSEPRPVRVERPASIQVIRAGPNYARKVAEDIAEAEKEGWFIQPGGLRSARLLAWLLCASTRSETHKFGDARPFGLLDSSGAPPEIVQWCSDLLVPRFRAMNEDAPKDEKYWILEVGRMRCARSVLVRAAMNVGAADLALRCAAAGGCGGRVPRMSVLQLPVYDRIMWGYWSDQSVTPSRIALPREIMMGGWDFFVRGASVDHFGEKLVYRLVRAAVKQQPQQQLTTTWFARAILLYPATLELVLRTLLCPTPPTPTTTTSERRALEEEEMDSSSAFVVRNAAKDVEMAQIVAERVMHGYVTAPEPYARDQVLVLLRFFCRLERARAPVVLRAAAFWRCHVAEALRVTRSADTDLLEALVKLAEATGAMAAFRAAAVVDCRGADYAERDAGLAGVLLGRWSAAGTDEVVEMADDQCTTFCDVRNNIYMQSVQRARRLGCPWGPEAGWYASDEATRMHQLEQLNAWIVAEQAI
jgi:hypothetical protein